MDTIGTSPGEQRLAGLSADLFHKVRKGVITLEELAQFVQRKNPFEFERNEHGHIVLTITGLDLTGEQEVERFAAAEFCVSSYAKSCLLSTKKDSYDKNHRLVAGQQYRVALMPAREIERSDRTIYALRKRGIEKYGYEKPLAGIMPRIREAVSYEQMVKMRFRYIVAPHDPIKDSDGNPSVLFENRYRDRPWLSSHLDHLDDLWLGSGAFAFLDDPNKPARLPRRVSHVAASQQFPHI